MTLRMESFENIVGKEDNTEGSDQHFLLLPQYFYLIKGKLHHLSHNNGGLTMWHKVHINVFRLTLYRVSSQIDVAKQVQSSGFESLFKSSSLSLIICKNQKSVFIYESIKKQKTSLTFYTVIIILSNALA